LAERAKNPSVVVRLLAEGEESLWAALAPDEPSDLAALIEARRREPLLFLLAFRGPAIVGRLRGRTLNPHLCFIREILVPDEEDLDEVAVALTRYLLGSLAETESEVLSWDRPEARALNRALERAGFVVGKEKAFVERDLAGFRSPLGPDLVYRSLTELGEGRFIEIMTLASTGDPFEDAAARDPIREFRELVAYAGSRFDPTWWRVAFLEGEPVGVVLPQVFEASEDEGSLFYIGVVPEHRGRGLGRALHAAGLEFLARKGVSRYVGSTDTRNHPMLAIFLSNGCRRTGTQLFYKPVSRRAAG
jgi:RimJ/RimL family protein N-acetyltransferase